MDWKEVLLFVAGSVIVIGLLIGFFSLPADVRAQIADVIDDLAEAAQAFEGD